MRTTLLLILVLILNAGVFAQSGIFYNVKDYGAKGDGQTIDTKAIDAAITAASEKGGGTIFFPAGTYLSFTIHLKSFITLHLDNGAVLETADVKKYGLDYDTAEPNPTDMYQDFGHSHWRNSLIYGENLQNIAITGLGTIFGNGLTREGFKTPGMANKAIALKLCRNVVIKDISILMSGHFAILATGVDNLILDNLKVDTNPDPQEFGDMPAYGFFIRHAKNIELNHVELKLENEDFRPALILDDVTGVSLNNLIVGKVVAVPSVVLKNSENIRMRDCRPFKDKEFRKISSTQL